MTIRNAAKAIILHENKILLNQCFAPNLGEYYALPGGGQQPNESMEQAVIRECREETGYTVVPEAFAALYEEIYTQASIQKQHPNHAHRILHIFRCRIEEGTPAAPTELDSWQRGSVWVALEEVPALALRPAYVKEHLGAIIASQTPLYLGSHFMDYQAKE